MTQFILPGLYTAQALSQAGVTHYQSENHAFFETIHKIQNLFDGLNIGALLIGGWELCVVIEREWGIFTWLADASVRVPEVLMMPLIATAGFVLAVYGVVYLANQYFKPAIDKDEVFRGMSAEGCANIDVEYDNSSYQVWMQCYAALQLVVSVALIFFSTMPVFYAASAALQLYTFVRTTGWRFIRIDRTFPETQAHYNERMDIRRGVDRGEGFIQCKFSYYLLLLPYTKVKEGQEQPECVVCMQDEVQLSHYCSNSGFCSPCMIKAIGTAAEHFAQGISGNRVHVTERDQYGNTTDEYIRYDIILQKEHLPNCPCCRRQPSQNEIEVHIEDQFRGRAPVWIKANVAIEEPVAAVAQAAVVAPQPEPADDEPMPMEPLAAAYAAEQVREGEEHQGEGNPAPVEDERHVRFPPELGVDEEADGSERKLDIHQLQLSLTPRRVQQLTAAASDESDAPEEEPGSELPQAPGGIPA